jgi:FtsH-binding integral membrane protein
VAELKVLNSFLKETLMNDFRSPNQRYSPPETWQNPQSGWGRLQTAAQVSLEERTGFIRKVYALFFLGILFGIGGVLLGFALPAVRVGIAQSPFIALILMIGGVFAANALRLKPGINIVALLGFTTLTGLIISPAMAAFAYYNPTSIVQAGVLTVGIFGGLTTYVFVSKKDFSFMRGMVVTGLIIVFLSALLNMFIASSAFGFAISVAALLLFSGFVLYDTSNIIRRYPTNEYIAGALSLYLDAFNIFLALLRILNSGRR